MAKLATSSIRVKVSEGALCTYSTPIIVFQEPVFYNAQGITISREQAGYAEEPVDYDQAGQYDDADYGTWQNPDREPEEMYG